MKLEADEEGKGDGLEDPFLVEGVLHLFQLHHLEDKQSVESEPVYSKPNQSVLGGRLHSTEVAYLLRVKQLRVRFPVFPKNFQRKNVDVAVVYQRHWLEESGQWLENVD